MIYFPPDLLNDHYKVCEKVPKKIPPRKPCVRPAKYEEEVIPIVHDEPELDPAPYDPDSILEVGQMKRMSKLQNTAILYMHKKSMEQHNNNRKSVQNKSKKLGFKASDLENLHFYIENYAPIIIHCHITRHMEFFIKDTHYRNQF